MRGSLNGIPALTKIPLLGRLFGSSEKTISQTDLIFSITPKIIRKTPITARDLETIWGGSEPAAGGIIPPETEEGEGEPAQEETQDNNNLVTISPSPANIPIPMSIFHSAFRLILRWPVFLLMAR
jgi:hypothetical protein